jgi:hypothetical protein
VAKFSHQLPAASLPSQWGNLSHAVGSLFCASLNFVARPEATAVQAISMHSSSSSSNAGGTDLGPQACSSTGDTADLSNSSSSLNGGAWFPAAARQHVLVASLPQEATCTENLTPWLKLLPCRLVKAQQQQQQQQHRQRNSRVLLNHMLNIQTGSVASMAAVLTGASGCIISVRTVV